MAMVGRAGREATLATAPRGRFVGGVVVASADATDPRKNRTRLRGRARSVGSRERGTSGRKARVELGSISWAAIGLQDDG